MGSGVLRMDSTQMVQPHYAEAWTLVAVLAKQPAKFAKLVEALQLNKDALAVIKEIYGWDEERLTQEWHRFVLAQVSAGGRAAIRCGCNARPLPREQEMRPLSALLTFVLVVVCLGAPPKVFFALPERKLCVAMRHGFSGFLPSICATSKSAAAATGPSRDGDAGQTGL